MLVCRVGLELVQSKTAHTKEVPMGSERGVAVGAADPTIIDVYVGGGPIC